MTFTGILIGLGVLWICCADSDVDRLPPLPRKRKRSRPCLPRPA